MNMNPFRIVQDLGEYSYANARCRAMIGTMASDPHETRETFEARIDDEMSEFEGKLLRIAPTSLKKDLSLFLSGRREVEALKIQFRTYQQEKKRREGIKVIKLSRWGALVQERMSNREVELSLDAQWFQKMKMTAFREFVIDLEHIYHGWYKMRSEGKQAPFDPLPLLQQRSISTPFDWSVMLKCYYEKLNQVQRRRKTAWEGY